MICLRSVRRQVGNDHGHKLLKNIGADSKKAIGRLQGWEKPMFFFK